MLPSTLTAASSFLTVVRDEREQKMTAQEKTKDGAGYLGNNEVHIHLLKTDEDLAPNPSINLLTLLTPDEHERYQGLGLESRRWEFLWSRLFVRHLLSLYTGKDMGILKWGTREKGKPFLEDSHLQFSLSHTRGLIACSVGPKTVGVDVEKIEDGSSARDRGQFLAGRFFSLTERDYLQSLPLELKNLAFFRIFTMKEAYAKAWGLGLSIPLNCLTVPLTGQEQSRQGSWEWFTRIEGDYCLSNVFENPTHSTCEYRSFQWNEKLLINALNHNRSFERNALCA
jgi:phosphopantetheinyl transferase